jgi:hypothetical protein
MRIHQAAVQQYFLTSWICVAGARREMPRKQLPRSWTRSSGTISKTQETHFSQGKFLICARGTGYIGVMGPDLRVFLNYISEFVFTEAAWHFQLFIIFTGTFFSCTTGTMKVILKKRFPCQREIPDPETHENDADPFPRYLIKNINNFFWFSLAQGFGSGSGSGSGFCKDRSFHICNDACSLLFIWISSYICQVHQFECWRYNKNLLYHDPADTVPLGTVPV